MRFYTVAMHIYISINTNWQHHTIFYQTVVAPMVLPLLGSRKLLGTILPLAWRAPMTKLVLVDWKVPSRQTVLSCHELPLMV